MMGHRSTFCSFLLILGRSARLDEDDRHADQVVFGLEGQSVSFHAPKGVWPFLQCRWPTDLEYPEKVDMLGGMGDRTGFVVKDFRHADEGRKYSITTNNKVTNYRAVLAKRIEVDVGAILSLHITTKISGEITWKYTSTSTTKHMDFVEVLGHGSRFEGRARVEATGKLSVIDWRWRDDGFFTAVINGEFAASFKVDSIVRVKTGGDLHLDPYLVEPIKKFSWYRDSTLVVDYVAGGGGVVYTFPFNNSNCNFDTTTGKLTVKPSQGSYDGVFTMMVNGESHKNGIKVVGDVNFISLKQNMQFTPPPFDVPFKSILWKHGKDKAAEYIGAPDNELDYYTICTNNN